MTANRPTHRCGYSYTADTMCGDAPAAHLLVDFLDGTGEQSVFTCAEHLGDARRTGLVRGEHPFVPACDGGTRYGWLFLSCGCTQCEIIEPGPVWVGP